ncbi:lactate utilization protein [Flaviaesturariibacter flavus]|uniref:Lactate utilization protein n=1 Tax=Flaviaesturariibacter flavus TaxID=2502780 RepID=A0A4R1BPZ7_9BACT|nr:lactate utilization protein B [Flaviaesturariibacter flavus]TCJ19588.1 lactate utilization protein [Flaviaesturariibacter flavus]
MNKALTHSEAAAGFLRDPERARWHDETLWFVRSKRDVAARTVPGWEALREQASRIKEHTLGRLDEYLEQFEQQATANGIRVHWAADGAEHNRIVHELLLRQGAKRIVKSKSMLTEECGLNPYLEARGLTVTDTDLGEYIVQLRREHPSHIVLPAIHLKKEDVSDTFNQHIGTERGNADPTYLTRAARAVLRERFLEADAAITGVNFAVAETGGIVICTNEGNADFGAHAAPLHIACMGLEKIIPKAEHLGVFLRLLARSATGQSITTYSSHFHRPRPGSELHIIIVDNGRTQQLGREQFRGSLKCIRCAACFNTCPVYRRSGGHSYHTAVAGPIGSILAPNLDRKANADLPFASTLCGSCTNVCPVKINIHEQLWHWRQELMKEGHGGLAKKTSMKVMAAVLGSPAGFRISGSLARAALRLAPWSLAHKWNPWYRGRELPDAPAESFTEWYKKNKR